VGGIGLCFRAPDAAVLARAADAGLAVAGASLSEPAAPVEPTVTGGLGQIGPTGGATPPALIAGDERSRRQILAALGVATMVILGGALSAFRRAPRPIPSAATGSRATVPRSAPLAAGEPAAVEAGST
jgi:hypothetical protein